MKELEKRTNKSLLNFGIGIVLGVIGVSMWNYDKFLYYTVFCVQSIIIYVLINSD